MKTTNMTQTTYILCLLLVTTNVSMLLVFARNPELKPAITFPALREKLGDLEYEDYVVMQAEISWGLEELKKYKQCKGGWPVREDRWQSSINLPVRT